MRFLSLETNDYKFVYLLTSVGVADIDIYTLVK